MEKPSTLKIIHLKEGSKNLRLIYLPEQKLVIRYQIKLNWIYNMEVKFSFQTLSVEIEPEQVYEYFKKGEMFNPKFTFHRHLEVSKKPKLMTDNNESNKFPLMFKSDKSYIRSTIVEGAPGSGMSAGVLSGFSKEQLINLGVWYQHPNNEVPPNEEL